MQLDVWQEDCKREDPLVVRHIPEIFTETDLSMGRGGQAATVRPSPSL
jgi:hypothetical protein